MPRLQKKKKQTNKVHVALCEVVVENLTLYFPLKIPISMWHCIVLTGITIKRSLYEWIANTKLWLWEINNPFRQTNNFPSKIKSWQ